MEETMVHKDPGEHDDLYVQIWGVEYRSSPEFQEWLKQVRADTKRGMIAHKNDLRDRLSTRTTEIRTW
ncbi:hypothetical protein JNK62_02330 [bacterium]|nr:hypothetical protein [bacterium]